MLALQKAGARAVTPEVALLPGMHANVDRADVCRCCFTVPAAASGLACMPLLSAMPVMTAC